MGVCLVGFRHSLNFLAPSHRGAFAVRGVHDLAGQPLDHRALVARARGVDQPTDGQRELSLGADFDGDLQVDTALKDSFAGRVCDLVIAEADAWNADLIVLGTHGRRGAGRLLMGSDAENVVRGARVPVLLLRSAIPSGAQGQAERPAQN